MTYQKFINDTIKTLTPLFSDDTEIHVETIIKNNGLNPKALIISEPDNNIFPTIYLDEYYNKLKSGESFINITTEILDTYNQYKINGKIDVDFISDFERIKSRIVLRLINREKNEKLLESIPWVPFLDLAVCYSIYFDTSTDIFAGSLVHTSHLKSWNTTPKEIHELAKTNSPRILPPLLRSIPEYLNEIAKEVIIDSSHSDNAAYVLTNECLTHGASCVLYNNILKDFAQKNQSDVFILPSSIHETMLLSSSEDVTLENLSSMVRDINSSYVSQGEFLSDHAYKYLLKSEKIIY